MYVKDLLLPNGMALQLGTDRIIPADQAQSPFEWQGIEGLSGNGATNAWHPETTQPNLGCPTGADVVADQLLRQLARQYLPTRKQGDDDVRWDILGGK